MLRIGLVDLDTSHPKAFTAILNQMPDVKVVALWDGHDVWDEGYDVQFAKENGIERVCKTLDDMVEHVDAAMIHGVDWDKHVDRALPFMKAKKPVLIDKPLVGKVRDIYRLLELEIKYDTIIYGGSSLRFADEIVAMKAKASEFGEITGAVASGPNDFFSYGIHTTEMAQGFLGVGAKSVEYIGENKSAWFKVTYHNGLLLFLQLHTPYFEWSFAVYSATGMHTTKVDASKLYQPFLQNFIKLVKGENISFSLSDALEAVKIHIAGKKAQQHRKVIYLDDLSADDGFDGIAYAIEYRLAKRRG
jgi:predicted dehydrogenase